MVCLYQLSSNVGEQKILHSKITFYYTQEITSFKFLELSEDFTTLSFIIMNNLNEMCKSTYIHAHTLMYTSA